MQDRQQTTLAEAGFVKHPVVTRKERFLNEMERIVPWAEIIALIEPHYPKPAGSGRRPLGLDRMLRVHFLQNWYNLSDKGAEEALIEIESMRRFAGFDRGRERMPDESTILQFRRLLEAHGLAEQVFERVRELLSDRGLMMSEGTIADATFIHAPESRKNKARRSDAEMGAGHKGKRSHFGLKAHVGVDKDSRLIHSVAVTAGNRHESPVSRHLVRGGEKEFWGDSAYASSAKLWLGGLCPGVRSMACRKGEPNKKLTAEDKAWNRSLEPVRCRVEHVFQVMKCRFGFRRVRFKGLAKNRQHVFMMCALVNLALAKDRLLAA